MRTNRRFTRALDSALLLIAGMAGIALSAGDPWAVAGGWVAVALSLIPMIAKNWGEEDGK